MFYIIVENQQISSVLNYEPNVPDDATVTEITDQQYSEIIVDKTHYFDIPTLTVVAYLQSHVDEEIAKKAQEIINAEKREFLNSTDWKIFRHIREKALAQSTSLTDSEYLALEQDRADAAAAIIEIQ